MALLQKAYIFAAILRCVSRVGRATFVGLNSIYLNNISLLSNQSFMLMVPAMPNWFLWRPATRSKLACSRDIDCRSHTSNLRQCNKVNKWNWEYWKLCPDWNDILMAWRIYDSQIRRWYKKERSVRVWRKAGLVMEKRKYVYICACTFIAAMRRRTVLALVNDVEIA